MSIRTKSSEGLEEVIASLRNIQNSQKYDVHSWQELEPLIVAVTKIQRGFVWLWYLIVTITVVFGLVNTLFMIILERVREFGLFQALGMSRTKVRVQVLLESLILIILGVVLGNLLSVLSLVMLREGIDLSSFTEAVDMYGVSSTVFLNLKIKDFLISSCLVMSIGILGSLYPARKASRLMPVDALRKV